MLIALLKLFEVRWNVKKNIFISYRNYISLLELKYKLFFAT